METPARKTSLEIEERELGRGRGDGDWVRGGFGSGRLDVFEARHRLAHWLGLGKRLGLMPFEPRDAGFQRAALE